MAIVKNISASCWRVCVGAISDKIKTTTEAASLGGEGQSTCRTCERIFRYPHRLLIDPLYKAPVGKGQAREAATYFCRPF